MYVSIYVYIHVLIFVSPLCLKLMHGIIALAYTCAFLYYELLIYFIYMYMYTYAIKHVYLYNSCKCFRLIVLDITLFEYTLHNSFY